jgi:hypothetical protein
VALERFLRYRPSWLTKGVNPERTVSQLLTELRGKNRVVDVARQTGLGRTSGSRLFAGKAAPEPPEFLQLVEVCSRRVLDLVVQFVPVEKLPSVRARWRSLELSRELAYSQPLSHAVLRALELDAYRSSAHRNPAFIARRLGVELQVVEESLALLKQSGQVQRRRGAGCRSKGRKSVELQCRSGELRHGCRARTRCASVAHVLLCVEVENVPIAVQFFEGITSDHYEKWSWSRRGRTIDCGLGILGGATPRLSCGWQRPRGCRTARGKKRRSRLFCTTPAG